MFTPLTKTALLTIVSLTIATSALLVSARDVRPRRFGQVSRRGAHVNMEGRQVITLPVSRQKREGADPKSTFKSRRDDAYNYERGTGGAVPVEALVAPVTFNGQETAAILLQNVAHGFIYDTQDATEKFFYDVAADKANKKLDDKVEDDTFGELDQFTIGSTVIGGVEAKGMGIAKRAQYKDTPVDWAGGIGLGLSSQEVGDHGWKAPGFVELTSSIYSFVLDDQQSGEVTIGAKPDNLADDFFTVPSAKPDAWTVSGKMGGKDFTADLSFTNGPIFAPKDHAAAIFEELGLKGEEGPKEGGGILSAKLDCGKGPKFSIDFGNGNVLNYSEDYTWIKQDDDSSDCIFFLVGIDQGPYPYEYTLGGAAVTGIAVVMDASDPKAPTIGFSSLKDAQK